MNAFVHHSLTYSATKLYIGTGNNDLYCGSSEYDANMLNEIGYLICFRYLFTSTAIPNLTLLAKKIPVLIYKYMS